MSAINLRLGEFDSWLKTMELSGLADDISFIQVRVDQNQSVQGKTPNFNVTADTVDVARSWLNNTSYGGVAAAFGGQHKRANLFIFDADTQEVANKVDALLLQHLVSPCYATTRKGKHFYFTYDPLEVQPPSPEKGQDCDIRANRTQHDGIKDVSVGCIILPGTVVYETKTQKRSIYQWHTDGGALPHLDADLYKALWELGKFDKKVTTPAGQVQHQYPWKNWQRKPKGIDQLVARLAKEPLGADVGGRNNYLHALATYCRHTMKFGQDLIAMALHAENSRFSESLPYEEVQIMAQRVGEYETEERERYTPETLVQNLTDRYEESGTRIAFNGNYVSYHDGVWSLMNPARGNGIDHLLAEQLIEDGINKGQNNLMAQAKLRMERTHYIDCGLNDWIANKPDSTSTWWKVVNDGIVDLHALAMNYLNPELGLKWKYDHTSDYFTFTKLNLNTEDIGTTNVLWEQNLERLIPEKETRDWFHKAFSIIALLDRQSVRETMLPILIGPPASGKSTLLEVLRDFVGEDYCSSEATFTADKKGNNWSHYGKQANIDTDLGASYSFKHAAGINKLISGEPIMFEGKYLNKVNAKPSAWFIAAANDIPNIHATEANSGIVRRLKLLHIAPFEGEPDINFLSKLMANRAGIFDWCVRGLAKYLEEGLKDTAAIKTAVKEEWDSNDLILDLIESNMVFGPSFTMTATELRQLTDSMRFPHDHSQSSTSPQKLYRTVRDRLMSEYGVQWKKTKTCNLYAGVKFQPFAMSYDQDHSASFRRNQLATLTPNPGTNVIDMHGRTTTL